VRGIGCLFGYPAIAKKYEPFVFVPIGFGKGLMALLMGATVSGKIVSSLVLGAGAKKAAS